MKLNLFRRSLGWAMITLSITLFTSGCGEKSRIKSLLETERVKAENACAQLEKKISSKAIRNITVLEQYADILGSKKPELKPIIRAMKQEGTTSGNIFVNLKERLSSSDLQVSKELSIHDQWKPILSEYQLIREACDPEMFNDALSDPINVLADLSDGMLARVQAMDRETSLRANRSTDFGPGSQLMGNPNYGYWQTSSSGTSFWVWYGMYSLFSDLTGRRYYYRDWGRYRDYSYYSDYGRHHYTSRANRVKQDQLQSKTRKSFGKRGKPFKSPYSKQMSGGTGVSRASKSNYSAAKRSPFSSSYAKKTTKPSGLSGSKSGKKSFGSSGSFRNSSQRVSRGGFFGK